jgi:hypothetical protein
MAVVINGRGAVRVMVFKCCMIFDNVPSYAFGFDFFSFPSKLIVYALALNEQNSYLVSGPKTVKKHFFARQ